MGQRSGTVRANCPKLRPEHRCEMTSRVRFITAVNRDPHTLTSYAVSRDARTVTRGSILSRFTVHGSPPSSFARRRARPGARADERLQLLHELGHVLELQIDRREADVGDLVEFLESAHDHLADLRGGPLALRRLLHVLLDGVDDAIELGRRDGPLLAGAQEARHHLVAVERLAPPILLDDHVGDFVNALVGRKAPLAAQALAAAANGVALARLARVNDLIFEVTAEGAFHKLQSRTGLRVGINGSASACFSASASASFLTTSSRRRATLRPLRRK